MYLAKSAGYDDTRSWEREDALFEEARRDVEKLKGFGSTVTEFESGDLASQLEEEIRQADGDEELPPRYGE